MAIDSRQYHQVFQNLSKQLTKLAKKPEADRVHKFRTYSRRVETFSENLLPERCGNDKKLVKLLSHLRKKAGRVRDLDVQIKALEGLKISQHADHKAQLLRKLHGEYSRREKKLSKAFDKKTVGDLLKRIARAENDAKGAIELIDPLPAAKRLFSELEKDTGPFTEKHLHQYRIVGKRARYVAEFAANSKEVEQFIEQLKKMQDVIGDWHDWLVLTERAKDLFGNAQDSTLVAMLQNLTRAKFRRSVLTLAETRKTLLEKQRESASAPRKPTTSSAKVSEQLKTAAVA